MYSFLNSGIFSPKRFKTFVNAKSVLKVDVSSPVAEN